jgi:hypothetical protein
VQQTHFALKHHYIAGHSTVTNDVLVTRAETGRLDLEVQKCSIYLYVCFHIFFSGLWSILDDETNNKERLVLLTC